MRKIVTGPYKLVAFFIAVVGTFICIPFTGIWWLIRKRRVRYLKDIYAVPFAVILIACFIPGTAMGLFPKLG